MLFPKKFIFFSFLEIVTKAYPFFANAIVLFEHDWIENPASFIIHSPLNQDLAARFQFGKGLVKYTGIDFVYGGQRIEGFRIKFFAIAQKNRKFCVLQHQRADVALLGNRVGNHSRAAQALGGKE